MKGAAKPARAGTGAKAGRGRSWFWLQGAVAGAAVTLIPGTTLLLGVLLCPAILFHVVDATPGRPVARTMLLMGCAASFRPLRDHWNGGSSVEAAFELLSNPSTALLSWFACGIGWLACETAYLMIRMTMRAKHQATIAALRREQAELTDEWALQVSDAKP